MTIHGFFVDDLDKQAGVGRLSTERCMISYKDARFWAKRRARLQRIVIEVAEQSERVAPRILHDFQRVSDGFGQPAGTDMLVHMEQSSDVGISHRARESSNAMLLVSPEGGWSLTEEAEGEQSTTPVSLGEFVSRVETAAFSVNGRVWTR